MKKIILNFIVLFIFIVSPNIMAETLDVSGLYIGERHNSPQGAKKFIDGLNLGEKCLLGLNFLCAGKKKYAYYVRQNKKGLHIWIPEKFTWFTGMELSSKGEFSGSSNKHTLAGYFKDDLFYAEFYWKESTLFYLVGTLSSQDKDIKEEIKRLTLLAATAAELEQMVKDLKEDKIVLNKKIKELNVEIERLTELAAKVPELELKVKDLEEDKIVLNKKIKELDRVIKGHPKINIHNLVLGDTVKKEVTLWGGPSKDTEKIRQLPEGSYIVELRRVKNDNRWTLVADDRGRLGYIETAYIISKTTISSGGDQPVVFIPTDKEIQITQPKGVKENKIVSVNAKGLTIIKGTFDNKKIENVKSITINKSEATFKGNQFKQTVAIKPGLNKINIKILTSAGDQYDYNFVIKAPD